MPPDICLCAPAEHVDDLYARELGLAEDCSCGDACERWCGPADERLYRAALEALVRALRSGVTVVGAHPSANEVHAWFA